MIYTIGYRESYEQCFREQAKPMKKGRTPDYCGGSVWITKDEALTHCEPGYTVYGVMADWDTETAARTDASWHDLLVDADLVKLDT